MHDQVQQIKERLNIVDIIGQYVKLTKAGKNYKGLSPFNNERTPSFFVSPDKGMYYDFSSSQGGDIFSFIQKVEGVDFKGALQILAEKAGITLQHESKGARDAREQLYVILEEATRFFETKLSEHTEAKAYLKQRGLEEATQRSFRLGFAPDAWQSVSDHLLSLGYREHDIERAGLSKKGERGKYYDRFRSRIMFPIMDTAGRVVAFSGRIFGVSAQDPKNAKYINSPETELFDKSGILFGYSKAKQFIRKYDFSILVEGQMDLVMSHQAGYMNTVAVSGTGLTSRHIQLLTRLSKKLVMAFDADPAGIASNGRAASLALRAGMDVKVAKVPLGKDPADCILEDAQRWKEAVRNAKHVVDFYIDITLEEGKKQNWEHRKVVLYARDTVLPYIQQVSSSIDKAQFVRTYANVFGVAEDAVWDELRTLSHASDVNPETQNKPQRTFDTQNDNTFSRKHDLERTLVGFLFWQETLEPRVLEEEEIMKKVQEFSIPLASLLARHSEERETLAFQAEIAHEQHQQPFDILHSLMKDLAHVYINEELNELILEIRHAERDNDEIRKEELDVRLHDLTIRKRALE